MKKLIFLLFILISIGVNAQRRQVQAATTVTGDTTFSVYPTDKIVGIFGVVDDSSTDSFMYNAEDSIILGGIWVQMDSTAIVPGEYFRFPVITENKYYLDSMTFHNRDGCITRIWFVK